MFSTQRHTGFDSNGRFDGTKKFYHAFVSALDDAFDAAQIAWVVDLVGFPHPVPPYQSLAREGVGAALIPGDTQLLKDFRRSNQDQNEKSSKAMSILKGMLGPIPTALIDPILADPRLSTRAKVVAAKLRLAAEYGMGNATSISAHIGDMDELPPILDGPSALQFISSLIMLNLVLRKMGAPQSDDQLRQRLYKNLIAPMFEKVALDIGANAAMTFAEACTAIQNIIDVKTQRDNHARHLSAMHPTLFQGTSSSPQIQSAWSTQPMSSSSIFAPPASYSAQTILPATIPRVSSDSLTAFFGEPGHSGDASAFFVFCSSRALLELLWHPSQSRLPCPILSQLQQ
jgi:hypothetical protein